MFIRPLQFIANASKRVTRAVLKTALAILPFNFCFAQTYTLDDIYYSLSDIKGNQYTWEKGDSLYSLLYDLYNVVNSPDKLNNFYWDHLSEKFVAINDYLQQYVSDLKSVNEAV